MSLLLIFNGGVIGPVTADLVVAEANDALSAAVGLEISGALGLTEADDGASASGALAVTGAGTGTEVDDSGVATAALAITATVDLGEGNDALSALAAAAVAASFAGLEVDDALSAGTALALAATFLVTEDDETLASFTQMPVLYPRRGGIDAVTERERRLKEWRADLRRIIDRSFGIAQGEIDPITFEPIPPPDHSKIRATLANAARSLDKARAETFMSRQLLMEEDEAIALLLLAA